MSLPTLAFQFNSITQNQGGRKLTPCHPKQKSPGGKMHATSHLKRKPLLFSAIFMAPARGLFFSWPLLPRAARQAWEAKMGSWSSSTAPAARKAMTGFGACLELTGEVDPPFFLPAHAYFLFGCGVFFFAVPKKPGRLPFLIGVYVFSWVKRNSSGWFGLVISAGRLRARGKGQASYYGL